MYAGINKFVVYKEQSQPKPVKKEQVEEKSDKDKD
jgi:hypothetical protein